MRPALSEANQPMTTTIVSNGQIADQVKRGVRVVGERRDVSRCHPIDLPAQGATSIPLTVTGIHAALARM
jgi:hypothetical protein